MGPGATLERDVVVETVPLRARRHRLGMFLGFAGLAGFAALARAAGAAAAAQHLHVVRDDFRRVTVVALLVLPLARAQPSLDVDLRTLAQVLAGDLAHAAEQRD